MASITSSLDVKGRAFVKVIITPSAFYQEAIGVDKFKADTGGLLGIADKYQYRGRALIDTGASCSSIDLDVAKKLGLVMRGQVPVNSPKGKHDYDAFDIDIFIGMDNLVLIPNRMVVACDIKAQGIQMLIGTDIIKLGTLVFEKGQTFRFSI
jgi:hypothetical protein